MKLRHLMACVVLALAALIAWPTAHAGEPPDPEYADMWAALADAKLERAAAVARKRVEDDRDTRSGRWFAAWEHVRGTHEGHAQRLEQAAHAADALGMNELSYRLWKRLLDSAEWANGRTRGRWAGVAAARSHHIDDAVEWLGEAADCEGSDRVEELRIWAASDMDPEDRLRFAERFWMPPEGQWYHPRPALDVLLAAHQRADLDDELVDRVARLTYECAVRVRDDFWIENIVQVWLRRREGADVLKVVEEVHAHLVETSASPQAEVDALRLLYFPEAEMSAPARVDAARHLLELGRDDVALAAFRRVIAAVGPPPASPDDAESDAELRRAAARNQAHEYAGRLLEGRDEFAEAHTHYEAWSPSTGCGNCDVFALGERELLLARCLVGLGRADEALERHVLPLYTLTDPFAGLYRGLLAFHVELEAGRGGLAQLETWLDEHAPEDAAAASAYAITRDFLDVRRAADARDARRLTVLLADAGERTVFHAAPYQDWEVPLLVRQAIDGLRACGFETAVAAIEQRFDALGDAPDTGDPHRGVLVHALHALGGDAALTALHAIDARLEKGEDLGVERSVVQQLIRKVAHGY